MAGRYRRELLLVVLLLLSGTAFAAYSDAFLSARNLTTILRNSVDLAVIAAGMTVVLVLGGIDVSVGGILAVATICIGRTWQAGGRSRRWLPWA